MLHFIEIDRIIQKVISYFFISNPNQAQKEEKRRVPLAIFFVGDSSLGKSGVAE